jgi:DNA-binding XRE family transcriptional regulator
MGRPRIQLDFAADVLARYQLGELNHHSIARIYGISPNTALQQLRRQGADTSRSTRKRLQFARRLGVTNLPERIAELYGRGFSLPQVGKQIGMTAEGVRKILIRHGVAVRSRGPKGAIWGQRGRGTDRKSLAARLRSLRRRAGLSQAQLADDSGVSQDTISGLETCRHVPSESTLHKLARALGVTLEALQGTGRVVRS